MVLGYLLTYGYILLVLLTSAAGGKLGFLGTEGRRKWIHVGLAFTWIILIRFFTDTIHMVIVPASFVVLNLLAFLLSVKGAASSIPFLSGMERKGEEETPGTVYYAASVMVMGILTLLVENMILPCGIGIFCMAYGDGFAGIFGKHAKGIFAKRIVGGKSLGGSLACMICSILGCLLLLLLTGDTVAFWKLAVIGFGCAVLELPGHGLDNLTVPFGTMVFARCLL